MQPAIKRGLHRVGAMLAIAGIIYVALRLRDYGGQIDFNRFGFGTWVLVGGFALIYGCADLMLAQAWRSLLEKFGARVTAHWAIKTYGISQLAKYVPGNILHIAGRQALGMAAGVPGWPLAKSSIWELALLTLAGAVIGMLALPLAAAGLSVPLAAIAFGLAVIGIVALLGRHFGRTAAQAFAWYVFFFAVSAALFVGLIKLVSTQPAPDVSLWLSVGGAYVLAWLAGFVTPGAPAGVGVRELVLMFLLQGLVNEADLLLVIVLGRAITVSGDLAFFLFASLLHGNTYERVK